MQIIIYAFLIIMAIRAVAKALDKSDADRLKDHRDALQFLDACSPNEAEWIKARCPQRYLSFQDVYQLDKQWMAQRS